MHKKQRIVACIAVFVLALIIPFPMTVVPEWKLCVSDEDGNPWMGKRVRRISHNYTVDFNDEGVMMTDNEGFVTFPKVTVWIPLSVRFVKTAFAYLTLIAHGSVGHHSSVDSQSPDGTKWVYFNGNDSPPKELILPRNYIPVEN